MGMCLCYRPSTMISGQFFILLVMYSSLAAANYCYSDLRFVVLGQKQPDRPWQATASIIKPGLENGEETPYSEGDSWNVTVNVQQCTDRCEIESFIEITAEGTRNKFEPLSGYTLYPQIGSYKFHPEFVSWDDARKICIAEGTHMAILNSAEEAQHLGDLFLQIGRPDIHNAFFVGIQDFYKEGEFTSILDEPLSSVGYSNWLPGEPNNAGGNEHCGTLVRNQGLNDLNCNDKQSFFCEQELTC